MVDVTRTDRTRADVDESEGYSGRDKVGASRDSRVDLRQPEERQPENRQAEHRRAALGEGMDHTPPERRGAVRAAGRHTARVHFLRRAMIIGSVLGVSIIAIVAAFDPFHHLPHGFSVSNVGVDGRIVTMESPKISGLRPDGNPYAISARQGIQDITKPDIMELRDLDATLGMTDQTRSHITADTGVYNGKIDTMTLKGHTRIKNSGGYDLMMNSALMDFKTGVLSSRERSTVGISGGVVSADRLDVTDNGHKVSFEGGVTSDFNPPEDAPPAALAPGGAERPGVDP